MIVPYPNPNLNPKLNPEGKLLGEIFRSRRKIILQLESDFVFEQEVSAFLPKSSKNMTFSSFAGMSIIPSTRIIKT